MINRSGWMDAANRGPVVEGKGGAKKRVRGVAKLFLSRSHLLTLASKARAGIAGSLTFVL